jgi:hypothetical protein
MKQKKQKGKQWNPFPLLGGTDCYASNISIQAAASAAHKASDEASPFDA